MRTCIRWFSSRRVFRDVDALPIPTDLRASLKGIGVCRLTSIQADCFPLILGGQSCVGIARTGEGKTLAYLVPSLARMMAEHMLDSSRTSFLIVLPTKDLCQQVGSVLVSLLPTVSLLLAFGKPSASFSVLLRQKPHVLIGTGGRIASLAKKGEIDLKSIKLAVFDEIDSMLIPDYCKEVTPLLDSLAPSTQVIAIGASMSPELKTLLSRFKAFSNSTQLNTVRSSGNQTPDKISHIAIKLQTQSLPLRISVAAGLLESRVFSQALVFAKNLDDAKSLTRHPLLWGKTGLLHGKLPQEERERTLNLFRTKSFPVLVCTDVASRGLDIEGVDLVVSLSPPLDPNVYLHRSGRTGRAGRKGESVLMYSTSEKHSIDEISSKLNFSFTNEPCPSRSSLRNVALTSLVQQALDRRLQSERYPKFYEYISQLSMQQKSTLVTTCMKALLGPSFDVTPPKTSILSGQKNFSPVLFVDPGKTTLSSRGDMMNLVEKLKLKPGLLAMSESGFILDLPTDSAISLCNEDLKDCVGVEPVLIDKVPKLIPDEGVFAGRRKARRTLPWSKKQVKAKSNRFL